MQANKKINITQESVTQLMTDLYHVFFSFHGHKEVATEEVSDFSKYYRLKKSRIYLRWRVRNNNKALGSHDLSQFFTIYESLDHLFTFDKFEHRHIKLATRAHDLLLLGDDEAGGLNLYLNKMADVMEESCDEFEFFLAKHSACISEAFYKQLGQIMDNDGDEFNQDLCQVLRAFILNKISIYRSTARIVSRRCPSPVEFNELLDPYEALDMFIARPLVPEILSFAEDLIQGWDQKYGTQVCAQILDLQNTVRTDFTKIEDLMMRYSAGMTSDKQVPQDNSVRLSLDYYVALASSCLERLRVSLAESSHERTLQKLFLAVMTSINWISKASSNYFQGKFILKEYFDTEILWSLFHPLSYLDLVINFKEVNDNQSSDYHGKIHHNVGSGIRRDLTLFTYAISHIYFLIPRYVLEIYKAKYNLNIDSLAAEETSKGIQNTRVHRVTYSLLFNDQDKDRFVRIFEDSKSKIDNMKDTAKFHIAAINKLIEEIKNRESSEEVNQVLSELLDGSLMHRVHSTHSINSKIEADLAAGNGWYTTNFFGFTEWLQLKILSQEGTNSICDRYDGNYYSDPKGKIKKSGIEGACELLYHLDRLDNVLIEYLHFNAYLEYGQDYDSEDLAINTSMNEFLVEASNTSCINNT